MPIQFYAIEIGIIESQPTCVQPVLVILVKDNCINWYWIEPSDMHQYRYESLDLYRYRFKPSAMLWYQFESVLVKAYRFYTRQSPIQLFNYVQRYFLFIPKQNPHKFIHTLVIHLVFKGV